MGDIADMMINGDMDFYTGEYIGRGKGIPRTLDGSLPWEKGKKGTTHGVVVFLSRKGVKSQVGQESVLRTYAMHKKWNIPKKKMVRKISAKIQENFPDFASWADRYLHTEKNKR
jgi:hypothetical protein